MALRRILPVQSRRTTVDSSFFIVNIVLLLILFFLATGQIMNTPSSGVDLSETRDLPVDNLPKPLLILGPEGQLSLDGEDIAPELLAQALVGQVRLHVLVDRTAPAITLVDLLARPELALIEVKLVTIHRVPGSGDGS